MITLTKAREISMDRIAGLEPAFRSRVRLWMDDLEKKGINILITEGVRTIERQKELYEKGVRPCAVPGQSYHNYGLAIDYVPLRKTAKWEGMYEADFGDEYSYEICTQMAGKYRIVGISTESGHLQDARYSDWREAKLSRETEA